MTVQDNVEVALDPVEWLAGVERAWQAHDGEAAAAGYTDDAVLIWGDGQTRRGSDLATWPQNWFDFAKDLQIKKTFRAMTGDCIATEWESVYTHPDNGKRIRERGAEFFFVRPDGKVYLHHMFEHTWPDPYA